MRRRPTARDLSIIIPAAGIGRRMKSYGPKALIEISNRETVIGRQIRILRSNFPTADIIVTVGYEAEHVIRALPSGIKIVENERYEQTNVVRSINIALRASCAESVLIVYSDLVFNEQAISWANAHGSGVLIDSRQQMDADEVGVTVANGYASHFSYGLSIRWGQIVYLAGRELELFRDIVSQTDKKKHFTFETFNSVIDSGGRFRTVEPHGMKIVEIDSSRDIEIAKRVDEDATRPIVSIRRI